MNRIYFRFLLFSVLFFNCAYAQKINVNNQSGNTDVWGAAYHLYKGGAVRAGAVKQIADNQQFALPALKENAGRYLLISRQKDLLKSSISDPFGTVGIRLISVGQSDVIGPKTSISLSQSYLPE